MTVARVSGALPVQPAALAKRLADVLKHVPAGSVPVVLVRAAPQWPHDPHLTLDTGRQVTVSPCVSPLALWDRIAGHDGQTPLALLTDLDVHEVGAGVLSRVWQQKIETVEPWDLICHEFGASGLEGELLDGEWAWVAEALLDARPSQGWTPVGGGTLGLDTALRQLAAVRLGLEQLSATGDDLDIALLLRWSTVPGLPEALWSLRDVERDGLVRWLCRQLGSAANAIFGLAAARHAADALPLGLVCQAVWADAGEDAVRARGRIEHWFAGPVGDHAISALASAACDLTTDLLDQRVTEADSNHGDARMLVDQVLARAEELLTQFGARDAAGRGDLLPSGVEARLTVLARAISDRLAGGDLAAAEKALSCLEAHRLARRDRPRLDRARAALRLLRWLSADCPPPVSVADGINRQVSEWAWVDRALAEVWLGDDRHSQLAATYTALYRQASQRRKRLDATFASKLAAWTAAGPSDGPDEPLLVEDLLATVLAPAGRKGAKPALFVVLDGMSAAVAVELAEQIARDGWSEYDPVGSGEPSRRGVVAALPTVTRVSRTSLFAGALRVGDQDTEQRAFAAHPWWRNGKPVLFHKEPTSTNVVAAITSDYPVVAVVINTVDEALGPGREAEEAGWDLSRLGPLRTLLRHARNAGRAVIITSDHGHILDRGGQLRTQDEPAKARYREGRAPVGEGEIELTGPRVINQGQRIVALWDTDVRYRNRKAGYHGGASLAEVTIPLLAYVPRGAQPPSGWAAVDARPPRWWDESPAPAGVVTPAKRPAPKGRPSTTRVARGDALFDLPELASSPSLADAVLATDVFAAQHRLTPRRIDLRKIRSVLVTLEESGGVAPLAVVAERAGEPQHRATGFLTLLQRIFNLDGFEVLALVDDGRTVRLNLARLREQFGIPR
ncbi:BREX-2 system phosphatase PglZ [Actinomycetes bacterium KLBMP 9797]